MEVKNLKEQITFDDLVRKVEHQEETVVQLLKIVAATNNRIAELQSQTKRHEKT